MKKLLFITWSVSYGYGTEKSLADVLNRMDPARYEIHVLPLFKYSDSSAFNSNIKVLDSLIDYTAQPFDEQEALKKYYRELGDPLQFNRRIRETYDCIIACNHNAPSYFASYLKGGARVLWIRGDMCELDYSQYPKDSAEYRQTRQEYEMQARVLKCFDAIAVISDVVQNTLKRLFGITEHVVKISNSVDREKIIRMSRQKVELPDKKLFTTLGRLDYNKNQILLLKAAREVRAVRNDFIVYLLGDGDERKHLEQYIRENNLEENVKILGFVENPYPYIRSSEAVVLTSMSEGFSLVLVESVMLNTRVISTDVGVAKELIRNYQCGDLITYDEKELAGMMIRYLDKYDGYRTKFEVGDEYDLNTEVAKTVDLLERAMRKSEKETKMKKLPYPEVTIQDYELEQHQIRSGSPYVLRVLKDGVPYEYLIHRKESSDKLIVFHNGAVAQGNVTVPVFQRHGWSGMLETSSVFCMDPTLYVSRYLQLGWGVGKNETYYLENSSLILKQVIQKMGIRLEDTVLYGSSAGGYLAILMGIYLKGAKVVADNAQLDVRNWIFRDTLDSVLTFCFDHIGTALDYRERFSVVDAFEKHGYVPQIFLHVNLCSEADNETQLVPFLRQAGKMRGINEYRGIKVILHLEPEKGHDGLGMEEAVRFLYQVLGIGE